MFKKWVEIENHYRDKYINKFFDKFPQLFEETYYISEKIDGGNFSVIVSADKIEYAKRSTTLGEESNFFDYQSIFIDTENENYNAQVNAFINDLQEYIIEYVPETTFQLVGEIFGKGIQNRVYYGEGKYWRWFGTYENGNLLSIQQEIELVEALGHKWFCMEDIRVPTLDMVKIEKDSNFQELLESLDEMKRANSLLTPEGYDKPNMMEGVVIRPYNDFYLGHDRFFIKYKNEEFFDKPKEKKPKKEFSKELKKIIDSILKYVNDNRTKDLFSKEGEIEEPKQIGNYIKLYLFDIYTDYAKEYGSVIDDLEKDDFKIVNKQLTNKIVKELQKNM